MLAVDDDVVCWCAMVYCAGELHGIGWRKPRIGLGTVVKVGLGHIERTAS